MIISMLDFLSRTQLDRETLEVWIGEEWLIPDETAGEPAFSDMGVNDEGIGIILDLLDQVHSLRQAMAETLPLKR
jgi:chaperone modulatory protein CbpM